MGIPLIILFAYPFASALENEQNTDALALFFYSGSYIDASPHHHHHHHRHPHLSFFPLSLMYCIPPTIICSKTQQKHQRSLLWITRFQSTSSALPICILCKEAAQLCCCSAPHSCSLYSSEFISLCRSIVCIKKEQHTGTNTNTEPLCLLSNAN